MIIFGRIKAETTMKHAQLKEIITKLKAKQVKFEHGLSDSEVQQIENKFNLTFPPDLRALLQTEIPISGNFVNWRLGLKSAVEADSIRKRIDWVFEGMAFDIEHNTYWYKKWGKKPDNLVDSLAIAKKHYQSYPKMIPICSHRYIPSHPNKAGNPVFSIYQTDVVYYGYDLAEYLANEFYFELSDRFTKVTSPRKIEFWKQFDGNVYDGVLGEPFYRFDNFDERSGLAKITFSHTDDVGQNFCFIAWEYYLLNLIEVLQVINENNWASLLTEHNKFGLDWVSKEWLKEEADDIEVLNTYWLYEVIKKLINDGFKVDTYMSEGYMCLDPVQHKKTININMINKSDFVFLEYYYFDYI